MTKYIKKEDAIAAFEWGDADVIEDYGDGCDFGFSRGNIKSIISSIPAADVEPVRRGNWIPISDGDGAECSECGEYFDTGGFAAFIKVYRYCPTCGARMDGGE